MAEDSDSDYSDIEYTTIDEKEAAEDSDSDVELQRQFQKGKLKPGIVDLRNITETKKECTNNVNGLKNKLAEFRLDLPWIERMDICIEAAALAPELNVEIQEHAQNREKVMRNKAKNFDVDEDPLHNDFKREMTFYRQAQAAVLEGYKRLKELGLPTMRPEDYFAEMAKSDDHMQKIRNRLMKKQKGLELSERVKKIRDIKKYGKRVQIEVEQKKIKEKKEMIDKLNKYRKGKIDSLDFLPKEDKENNPRQGGGKSKSKVKKKYPFGKNRYTKRNCAADIDEGPSKKGRNKNKFIPRSGKKKREMRPGKMRRNTMKNKGSRSRRK
ncbi:probable rRNA-processing protein EBP2 homolog [Macrobrachium nipponense]|uniref:probable rRNA-processing protein EBP2 homolog n=1 Tax=Macrobrachium nipponense TaxID=159736 RepID=UPI0030C8CE5F